MANSIRKQIIDAMIARLETSTGIETVEENLKRWDGYNAHEFPVVTVLDQDTDIERLSFFHSSNDDKKAFMDVRIRGYVWDQNNITAVKRTNLIRDIQKTLVPGSTDMNALIVDLEDTSIETDDGILDNFSVFDINYRVQYHYNHATP